MLINVCNLNIISHHRFINIVSPVIGVPLLPFWVGTFFGVAPPSFIFIQAGTTLQQLTSTMDPITVETVLLLIVFALLSLLPIVLKNKLKAKFEWLYGHQGSLTTRWTSNVCCRLNPPTCCVILTFLLLRSCCDTDKVTNYSTNNENIEISTNLDINVAPSTPETVVLIKYYYIDVLHKTFSIWSH